MLSKRFKYNDNPVLILNELQQENKLIVDNKLKSGQYKLENIPCVVCGKNNFEQIAEKDRYGLYVSTVICKRCGLLQTNPRMTQESYNDFYETNYRKLYVGEEVPTKKFYDKQIRHGEEILYYIEKKTKREFRDKFVVEIGSGAGGTLEPFQEKDNQVFGLDLGSKYIEYGKKRGIPLEVGTIEKLKNLQRKPDLVLYCHVLEHILNPYEELVELKKYLKKSSLLYIEVPGVKNLKSTYHQDFLRYLQNAHTYHFSLATLKNLTKKAGFDLVDGDEITYSLFRPGRKSRQFYSDYDETMLYLKELEKIRNNPLNILKFWDTATGFAINITKRAGVYAIVSKLYRSLNLWGLIRKIRRERKMKALRSQLHRELSEDIKS